MPDLPANWLWAIVVVVLGIVTLKVDVASLITNWTDIRNKKRKSKLQSICPHIELTPHKDGIKATSTIRGLPASYHAQCLLCGALTYKSFDDADANAEFDSRARYWMSKPAKYEKTVKKIAKLRRKII